MSFKKDHYLVIKNAVDENLTKFLNDYFLLKEKAVRQMFEDRVIPNFCTLVGRFDDDQVPGAFSCYSDFAFETLLQNLKKTIENKTKMKLIETYSYARVYRTGHDLKKHIDRKSCDISGTVNLGGDPWPIFMEGNKILLNPGDLVIYRGEKLVHWREKFEGKYCCQVFLHYNDKKDPDNIAYDGRKLLGSQKNIF